MGQRNAPTLLNALYNKTQFWDGRVNTLEQQAALPITNPFEMGSDSVADAVARIADDKDYREQFKAAFGRDVNEQDLVRALATYERTLVSFSSPFDRFIAGDQSALSDAAKHGWELFNKQGPVQQVPRVGREGTRSTLLHRQRVPQHRHRHPEASRRAARAARRSASSAQGTAPAIDAKAIESEISALGRFLITRK